MGRTIVAVIAGFAVWTALWLTGNGLFTNPISAASDGSEARLGPSTLLVALGISILCSLAAGTSTAWLARHHRQRSLWALALTLLATGVAVQASSWTLMPLWYHASFLVLLVPMVFLGGRTLARAEPLQFRASA